MYEENWLRIRSSVYAFSASQNQLDQHMIKHSGKT